MKKTLTTIATAMLLTATAHAADFSDLRASVGISGSNAVYAATGTEKDYGAGAVVKTTKEYGAFSDAYGSIFAELGNDFISVGIDYVPGKIETPQNISNENQSNQNRVSADFDKLTTIYAKLNIPQLGGTYLKVGYSKVDVIVNEAMASGSTYADTDTSGMTYGLGYNHDLGVGGVSIRAELLYATFSDVTANNGKATSVTGDNPSRNEITISDMEGARGTISIVKTF